MSRKKYDNLSPEEKEQLILDFINKSSSEKGYSPSIREIQKYMGFASTSTVHEYITKLESKGFISFENSKARTLSINRKDSIPEISKDEIVQCNNNSITITIKLDNASLLTLDKYCKTYDTDVNEAIKIAINFLK